MIIRHENKIIHAFRQGLPVVAAGPIGIAAGSCDIHTEDQSLLLGLTAQIGHEACEGITIFFIDVLKIDIDSIKTVRFSLFQELVNDKALGMGVLKEFMSKIRIKGIGHKRPDLVPFLWARSVYLAQPRLPPFHIPPLHGTNTAKQRSGLGPWAAMKDPRWDHPYAAKPY